MNRLPLKDTRLTYGRGTRALHWGIALLILLQFTGMALKLTLGRESEIAGFFVRYHQPMGGVLFVLIVARVLWALANRGHRPGHSGLTGRLAPVGHGLLYVLMLAVPTLALIRAWGSERGYAPFGVVIFEPKAAAIPWTQQAGSIHGELAWTLGALILGHILMVALHELFWRDGTLRRMAGRDGRRGSRLG